MKETEALVTEAIATINAGLRLDVHDLISFLLDRNTVNNEIYSFLQFQ